MQIINSHKKPHLTISQKDGKVTRNFNVKWYEKLYWLTGSEETKRLYCFPCLLFGDDSPWVKYGINIIKKIVDKVNKHAVSRKHIFASECFRMLGKTRIDHVLVEAKRMEGIRHNEKVSKNRKLLGG